MEKSRTIPDIVEYALVVLKKLGIFSTIKSKKVLVVSALYTFMTLTIVSVCLLQFMYVERDITEYTYNAEGLGGLFQALSKFTIMAYQQSELADLLASTKPFWKTSKCSPEVKIKLDNISARIIQLERVFFGSMIVSTALAEITVLFGRKLPLGIWKFEDSGIAYTFYLGLQLLFLPVIAVFLGAFDCLFFALCAKSIIQFRILCHCITQLNATYANALTDPATYHLKLRECVEHHIFLLKFLKALQNMYSSLLLAQYVSSSSLICVDMYSLFELEDVALQVREVLIVTTHALQLTFYCIATDFVTHEALEVSNAMFNSGWYLQRSTSLRNIITIAIQRSQCQTQFKAGGLVDINARAIVTVLRASWSICTIMRRIKKGR